MGHSSHQQDPVVVIESLQEFYSDILEYYDELFPLDPSIPGFILALRQQIGLDPQQKPADTPVPFCRLLGIGCATGTLENRLAGMQIDVTGIDRNPQMIETAKRRMKRGFSTARFFEMSALEMRRFLKEGSFNIITCLDNMLPYIADETLIKKFFYDAKNLLADGGRLVIQVFTFDENDSARALQLPERSSLRVTLTRMHLPAEEGKKTLAAELQLGNGRILQLARTTQLYPLTRSDIENWSREAGFTSCELYGNFDGAPWNRDGEYTVAVLG